MFDCCVEMPYPLQSGNLLTSVGQGVLIVQERVPWLSELISIGRNSNGLEDICGTCTVFATISADVATKQWLSPLMWICYVVGQSPNQGSLRHVGHGHSCQRRAPGPDDLNGSLCNDAPKSDLVGAAVRSSLSPSVATSAAFHPASRSSPASTFGRMRSASCIVILFEIGVIRAMSTYPGTTLSRPARPCPLARRSLHEP